jgi:hypothetical protein
VRIGPRDRYAPVDLLRLRSRWSRYHGHVPETTRQRPGRRFKGRVGHGVTDRSPGGCREHGSGILVIRAGRKDLSCAT